MNPVIQKLLRDPESLSGTPVQVVHDADLPISARIQFARNGASHHVLVVKPGRWRTMPSPTSLGS